MTDQERIENVKSLGYSEREAAFVTLASLHSGYFLRRQYCAFAGSEWGGADGKLIDKLRARNHAKELAVRNWRRIYSISSKAVFDALGDVDNRNRRLHEPQTIKARLMSLDYVIAHPEFAWYATESERVCLFTDQLGVDRVHLPVWRYASKRNDALTLRWFVDKPPIFLSEGDATVHFCFTDPGFHTADSFASFLRNYRRLFARLTAFEVIYITEASHTAERARRLFKRFYSAEQSAPEDPLLADLLRYFGDRAEHEVEGLSGFNKQRIDRYREDRKRFSAERYQRLFEVWKLRGEAALKTSLSPESSVDLSHQASFSVSLVEPRYSWTNRSSRHTPPSRVSSGSSSPSVASYV
jgi:hypothetical protein